MRFKSDASPPPVLSRKDQFRIFSLLVALGTILFAIQFAARPQSWYWLVPPQAEQSDEPSLNSTDAREESTVQIKIEEQADEDPEGSMAPSDPEAVRHLPARENIDALLGSVRDNTLGIQPDEAAAYYALLAAARDTPLDELERQAHSDLTYTQFMGEPQRYRGTLVTVEGELKRLNPLSAGPNEYGFNRLYEGWLINRDSGPYPVRIVFTEVPSGIPMGNDISVLISTTGYFFKRFGYEAQRGLQVAPLLLAKRPHWSPAEALETKVASRTAYLATAVAGMVVFGFILWRYQHRQRLLKEDRKRRRRAEAPREAVQGFGE